MAYPGVVEPRTLGRLSLARFNRLAERDRGPSLGPLTRQRQDEASARAVDTYRQELARRSAHLTAL